MFGTTYFDEIKINWIW